MWEEVEEEEEDDFDRVVASFVVAFGGTTSSWCRTRLEEKVVVAMSSLDVAGT
jgi:hypothetical protein